MKNFTYRAVFVLFGFIFICTNSFGQNLKEKEQTKKKEVSIQGAISEPETKFQSVPQNFTIPELPIPEIKNSELLYPSNHAISPKDLQAYQKQIQENEKKVEQAKLKRDKMATEIAKRKSTEPKNTNK